MKRWILSQVARERADAEQASRQKRAWCPNHQCVTTFERMRYTTQWHCVVCWYTYKTEPRTCK